MGSSQSLKIEKRRCVYAGIPGVLLGFSLVFGYQLQTGNNVLFHESGTWILCGLLSLIFTVVFYKVLAIKLSFGAKGFGKLSSKSFSFLCFAWLYFWWVIQLLGVYPGFFNYDAPGQWEMYAISQITAHHPVIHTLLIGKCIHASFLIFKSALPGVFLYNLIQLFVSGLVFTQVFRYMYKKRLPRPILIFSLLWCSFFSTVVLSLLSVTKDSFFAPLMVSFVVSTIEILEDKEAFFSKWYKMASWGIVAILMTIMRNNAVYIAIPFFFVLIWVFRKYWKKYLILLAGMLVLYGLYVGPFCNHYTVQGVSTQEFLSVPCQQIMRVYHTETDLAEEQQEVIETLFKDEALNLYAPKIADVAKRNIDLNLVGENKAEYLKFWLDLGLRYPATYVNAFLEGNFGFWYPWATLILHSDGAEGYWVCKSYNPVWNESKISFIESYYSFFGYNELVCKNPLTMWIFAPATYFWMTMLVCMVLLYKRRKEAIVFVFVLLVWLTFLLGPVALARYVSFLYYLVPFEVALLFHVFKDDGEELGV